ncbi:MAG TPA: GyrI-like domain-containing protein [Thermotogota bacterium]|nr:GyrI-like domain-containing protein [Thermotogota bacterium]HRW93385.1 GyrI-like domain-containing protein [Thermotogota bacterium]
MLQEYIARINLVMDFIEKNLQRPMTLEELSSVAGFSRFHFHRIFSAFLGETLGQFISRVRVEKAATILVTDPARSITDVALDCGFSSSSAFSRAFRDFFGKTPSAWRRKYDASMDFQQSNLGQIQGNFGKEKSSSDLYNYQVNQQKQRRMRMNDKPSTHVEVKDFPKTTVAYVRYIGPYQGDGALFENLFNRLCGWAGPRGLLERENADFLIIYHDDPAVTEEAKLRTSVCLTVPEDTQVDGDVGKMEIPAGPYVFARFELGTEEYGAAWSWVYGQWLPQSGYVPDDRPGFEFYPKDVKSSEEGKTVVDICVPLKKG